MKPSKEQIRELRRRLILAINEDHRFIVISPEYFKFILLLIQKDQTWKQTE